MENTKYDDKFYRLSKRLFKEEQFRSMTNEWTLEELFSAFFCSLR